MENQFKRGQKVWVSDNDPDCREKMERIFLAEIQGANYPIICVSINNESYFNGSSDFSTSKFRFAKKVEDPVEYSIEKLYEIVGHKFVIKN